MPESGYSWRRSSALCTQRALFGLTQRRRCMATTATQTPPTPCPLFTLHSPCHLLNLQYLHSPVQGVGRGHAFNFYFFPCAAWTKRVYRMNRTVRSPALGWMVAVNNCDALFKPACCSTWAQFTKSAEIYSHESRQCFLLQEESVLSAVYSK